jgi:hypothetical protein
MTADDLSATFRTARAASTGIESTGGSAAAVPEPGDDRLGTSPGLVE